MWLTAVMWRFLNRNKRLAGFVVFFGVCICSVVVGCYMFNTMQVEILEWLAENPGEVLEVGGPPVMTSLFPLIVVGFVCIVMFFWLLFDTKR